MSQISIRQLWKALATETVIAVGLLLTGLNGPARAGPILDPLGDLLPTYTGAQDAGLDVLAHEVTLVGDRLNFFGQMAGPIAPTQAVGGLYLIGVDRGLGTPRFLNSPAAPPSIGPNVKWDAIVRILPNGPAFYLNSLLGVTTPLPTSDVSIIGNEFNVSIPVSLMLPSATKPPEEWTYNLWPRNGVGLNVQVSDLAPDDGNSPVHSVPEPASLTACGIGAVGLLGCRWRRRSRRARESVTRRQRKDKSVTKRWMVIATASLGTLLALFAPPQLARADIFQWKYINPANPGLGKQQSTTLAPDGAGVYAEPGANLSYRNLTMAYLIGADLRSYPFHYDEEGNVIDYYGADLTGANLSQADLTDANLEAATLANANLNQADVTNALLFGASLTGANFTNAQVRGAQFYLSNLSTAQLYSTASYLNHDLSTIQFPAFDLAGWNFSGQNLTGADFTSATLTNADLRQANLTKTQLVRTTLTGANLTGAEVRGAVFSNPSGFTAAQLYSTASYQDHDLTGIGLGSTNMTGWDLSGQNLTDAFFNGATLTGVNLTDADIRGANLDYCGLTATQLYSTASYQLHDLSGIALGGGFSGVSFLGQNLTGADIRGIFIGSSFSEATLTHVRFGGIDLTNAIFTHANLANASFPDWATMTGAILTGADARGAAFLDSRTGSPVPFLDKLTKATTTNLIQPDGHIAGLQLTAGASLVVRDYDGNPTANPPAGPLPIVVEQRLAMNAAGTLRLEFDDDAWDSTISFAPGISVARGGVLELAFAPGIDIAAQSGRTIDLFNWTDVNPTGVFTIASPYSWDLTKLYTTGEITLLPTADFNGDNRVDGADLASWKTGFGAIGSATHAQGDADGDHDVDGNDFLAWQRRLGSGALASPTGSAVPEPATLLLVIVAVIGTRRIGGRTCRELVNA